MLLPHSAGLLIAGLAVLASVASAQSLDTERRALESAKAQSAIASARAEALERRSELSSTESARALAASAALAARIQSSEADIAAAEARIRLIERLRRELRVRLAEKQGPAVRLLSALVTMERRPPALALVQPGSTGDMVHVRAVLSSTLPVLERRTEALRRDVVAGQRLRADADRALQLLATGQKRLRDQRAQLLALASLRRRDAARFASGAMLEQDRAIAMGEKARDLQDLIGRLGDDASRREALETLPGPLLRPANPGLARSLPSEGTARPRNRLPYRMPVIGRIVTGLGEVSGTGVRARGLTIVTRPSALVVAPNSGRIVFAAPYRGFGRIVIIDHGASWTTLVTGLAALDVAVGDAVVQGSPLGRAAAADPKVMVELRHGNRPIDITHLVG